MTAARLAAPLDSPQFTGSPTAPTQASGDATTALATDEFVSRTAKKAILLSRVGVQTNASDCADVPISVPFAMTLTGLTVTMLSAPSGAMVVQLRTATGPITTAPTYSNVSGFTATFVSGQVTAAASSPTPVTVAAGDFLNFSCTTSSGTNLLVEVVATT